MGDDAEGEVEGVDLSFVVSSLHISFCYYRDVKNWELHTAEAEMCRPRTSCVIRVGKLNRRKHLEDARTRRNRGQC